MTDTLSSLRTAIETRSAAVGVIGLGYVGLPAACVIAEAGFKVTGIEIDAKRVEMINSGQSPIEGDEPGLAGLLTRVIDSRRRTMVKRTDFEIAGDTMQFNTLTHQGTMTGNVRMTIFNQKEIAGPAAKP